MTIARLTSQKTRPAAVLLHLLLPQIVLPATFTNSARQPVGCSSDISRGRAEFS